MSAELLEIRHFWLCEEWFAILTLTKEHLLCVQKKGKFKAKI